jgi:rhodanese-related sulfurtransferase
MDPTPKQRTWLAALSKRTRRLLYGIFAVATGVPLFWHLFEHLWDRHLFRRPPGRPAAWNLDAEDFAKILRDDESIQLLDVRPQSSFDVCRIPRSVSVPFVGGDFDAARIASLDLAKPVAIYCDGGFRSRFALSRLKHLGANEVHHLHRGLLGWRLLGLPVAREGSASHCADDDTGKVSLRRVESRKEKGAKK